MRDEYLSVRARRRHRCRAQFFRPLKGERLEERAMLAVAPYLLGDLNQAPVGVSVQTPMVERGGLAYFGGSTSGVNAGLWKTDGTTAGTSLVKAFNIFGSEVINVGGTLFFEADNASSGRELWKSDGTAAGTVQVKDIVSGTIGSAPRYLTNVNGTLFFTASSDASNGEELWKSDGTAAGTVLVKDIQPGFFGSRPYELTNVNGVLFFVADDGVAGEELWKSDGTSAGTTRVKDILPGDFGFGPSELTSNGTTLFFVANDNVTGEELWKSDGTAAGTVVVKELQAGNNAFGPSLLTNVGGKIFFVGNDGVSGNELWQTDGTAAGTTLVKDLSSGIFTSFPDDLTNVNGTLFFGAWGDGTGPALWKTDGTPAGTTLVSEVGFVDQLANIGGVLYFRATGPGGNEPWRSDGTPAGTTLIKDLIPTGSSQPRDFLGIASGVLFTATGGGGIDYELWKTDGTAAGTVYVRRDLVSTASSTPSVMTTVGGLTFFRAHNDVSGAELWKTDGTIPGTVLVKDIFPGLNNSVPNYLTNHNGTLLFPASDNISGNELWKSDGSAGGTTLLKDILPGATGSFPKFLTTIGGTTFFVASDGTTGAELWKTDGTTAGTVLVRDIRTGAGGSSPNSLINVNGTLFFLANDGTNGYELWKSDGTSGGTSLIKNINTGSANSGASNLTVVGGLLYFSANDGTNGVELWKSDGTSGGTVLVKNIRPGVNSSAPTFFVNLNGTLIFRANDGTSGDELWKSDGTSGGTVLVTDLVAGSGGSGPTNLASANGLVFFSANASSAGTELWKSDGTAAGTALVKDIRAGTLGSGPSKGVNVGGTLYFSAIDDVAGIELWRSDGTAGGTERVADLRPGILGSAPGTFFNSNGRLLFTADDGIFGFELWLAADNALPVANPDRYTTERNVPVTINQVGVQGNDVDPDGPLQIVALESGVAGAAGTLTLNANGTLTFAPATDFVGAASFSYRVNDGLATSLPAVVTINVTAAANTPPIAANDTHQTAEDTPLVIGPVGLLAIDSDGDNDTLNAVAAVGPAHGSLTIQPHGGFVYSPATNYFGPDSFTYRSADGQSLSPPATVFLTITPVNDAPAIGVINNPAAILEEAAAQTVNFSGVNAGPGETQGIAITATSSNPGLIPHPTVTYTSPNATGSLSYTPVANQSGTATITVTVTDDGGTDGGGVNQFVRTFTVSVTAVNDAPTLDAITDPAPILEDAGTQNFNLTGISAGSSESQTLTITATSNNTALIPNPTISYTSANATALLALTPAANQSGTAIITVRVQDNGGTANSGVNFVTRSFAVVVTPVNDPPTAANDSYATTQNVPLYVNGPGVLVNDRDIENDPLKAILVAGPASGTLNLNANGSLVYQPANGFTGPVSFTYRARDPQDNSVAPATVTINVAAAQPATAGVSGSLWNDQNGDGTRNAGELPVGGGTVYVDLNDNGVRDTLSLLEPDQFAAGASLATANPRVTLSAVDAAGTPVATTITAVDGGGFASTGSLVIGQGGNPFFHLDRRLKLAFSTPVDRLAIDFIGGNAGDSEIGRLEIYNAAGKLLNAYVTQPRAAGQVERMTLVSQKTDIAYTIAYTDAAGGLGRLDNLSISLTEPSAVTAADGSYTLNNLTPGKAAIRPDVPAGFRVTAPQISGRRLFAVDTSAAALRIVELNPATGAVLRSFNAPTSETFYDTGLAFDGQTLYFVSDENKTLYELDPETGAVRDSMNVAFGSFISSLGVSGGRVFVLDWSSRNVRIIDPVTNSVVGTQNWEAINDGFFLDDVLGDSPTTGELVTSTSDYVAFVNPATGVRTGSIGVGNGFSIVSVQVIGDEVFVAYGFPNKIDVYSRSTRALLRSMPLSFAAEGMAGIGDASGAQRVVLAAGQTAANVEFGSQFVLGSLRGTKWQDGNSNGVGDAGEPPLAGKTIYLDLNDNSVRDSGEPAAVTAADGSYVFNDVAPGNYIVRQEVTAPGVATAPKFTRDRLFVTEEFDNKIYELNPQTGAILNSFAEPGAGSIFNGLAFDGKTLYSLNSSSKVLYEINPDTGAVLDSTPLVGSSFEGLAALGGLVYIKGPTSGAITVFNPTTNTVVRTMTISGFPAGFFEQPLGEMTNPDRLLGLGLFSELLEIDPATGAASVTFNVGISVPYALTSVGNEIFVGDSSGIIEVYSRTGTLLRTLTGGPEAFSLGGAAGNYGAHRVALGIAQAINGLDFGSTEIPSIAAGNDTATTQEDAELNVAAPGVLANDSGAGVSAVLDAGPAHGTLSLLPTGGFTYRPALNYHGPDSFTYHVSDGATSSGIATVALTVTSVNDPPAAQNDAHTITEDTPLTVPAPGLVSNDSDVELQVITAVLGSGPAHGTVSLLAGGGFTYSPSTDYVGTDSFTYRPSDGAAQGELATVTLTITPVNDPPSFVKGPDQQANDEIGLRSIAGWATAIIAGPSDESALPARQTLTFEVIAADPSLFLEPPAIDALGALTFAPRLGANGTTQVTVTLRDSGGAANNGIDASATQTFAIAISRLRPWHNIVKPLDVTDNGIIAPGDAIAVINYLNRPGGGGPIQPGPPPNQAMIDVDGNGSIGPVDAIMIINHLNRPAPAAPLPEGESPLLGSFGGSTSAAGDENLADVLTLLALDVAQQPKRRRR